eukprot:6426434-Amphidinium_carterae.1
MKKELLNIKGLSDQKVEKIVEAARKSTSAGFLTCSQLAARNQKRFVLATGAAKLDQMLGGGVGSSSITELFGEARCGKSQICHT